MVESQVGVAILPASAARRHALTMSIDTVPLADDWAVRQMQICMRSLQALPAFARDLVDLLVQDAAVEAAGPARPAG
jgi:DNA-binding transcriptional LysR family regulator